MKKYLPSLLALILLLSTSCSKKADPTPTPSMPPNATSVTCRVYDAAGTGQFNTKLTASVFYFPLYYTKEQVFSAFKFNDPNGFDFQPRVSDDVWHIDNAVSATGYDGQPGAFTRIVLSNRQVAITWRYEDADPNAPITYRFGFSYLGIPQGRPMTVEIQPDKFRAGL